MNPSTTFHLPPVTDHTFQRRLQQLTDEIMQHPHSQEVLRLVEEQIADDTFVLVADTHQ